MSEYMFKTYIANGREYFIYSDDVSDDHFTQKIDFPFSESLFPCSTWTSGNGNPRSRRSTVRF